ncbi:MAG: carboxyl transferase [Lachnospiraceae bacterium]|nr:carboxyl transferase [Lachnospiraceae bacterium]
MGSSTSLSRGRIDQLLDEKSFVEIGSAIKARATDFNQKPADAASDGVVTGYGTIEGRRVYVYSQDAAVLGGSIGEMHAKKICAIYDLALKTGTPVIGLIDSTGLRLTESTDALNSLGEIYFKQAMAKGVVPQITAVFGNCGGGLALVPAMTDFCFMEEKNGHIFVNSPDAIDGNYTEKNDTSAAKFQFEESGNADFVGSAEEICADIRKLVTMLPQNDDDVAITDTQDDLNRVIPDLAGAAGDTSILLSNIADDNDFVEVGSGYAKDMVTGFIRLDGITVGCVANRCEIVGDDGKVNKLSGRMSHKGAYKAADFVYFCDSFGIPVLSVTNVTGFEATMCSEKNMAKAAATLTEAFANCDVPRVNLIVGKAYGSAYVCMNSKGIGADLVYAWPGAEIGPMEAKQAAKLLYEGKDAALVDAAAKEFAALQNNAASAAARGYVDAIIEPQDSRKHLIYAIEMLFE